MIKQIFAKQINRFDKFFIDFSFSIMGGKTSNVGKTVVLSSFLLGGPSGSGVATTVTVGAVAHNMLAKAGYEKNAAGGLLAAGGLGAGSGASQAASPARTAKAAHPLTAAHLPRPRRAQRYRRARRAGNRPAPNAPTPRSWRRR